MRSGFILILLFLVGFGCRKKESHDITVWRMPKNGALTIEFGYTAVSMDVFDRVLNEATAMFPDARLIVCLPHDVSITNAFDLLTVAERCGITKAVVSMNQIRPPYVPKPGDRGIDYEMLKEWAPTKGSSRTGDPLRGSPAGQP